MPEVVMLGQFPLATGVVTGLVGLLLAYWLARSARDLVMDLALGALLGAKLLYVAMDPLGYVKNPVMLILFPYGVLAVPSAIIGALAMGAWALRRAPDRLHLVDQAAPPLVLGLAVAAIGWTGPGAVAFAPALGAAAGVSFLTVRRGRAPGHAAAQTVVLTAGALTLADLARPAAGLFAGITTLQLAAALAGTAAWLWLGRANEKEDPGT